MARTDTLPHFLTDVADAIRTKTGESLPIQASNFDTAIENIPSGGEYAPSYVSFYNFPGSSLEDEIEGLDTSNITTMNSMFYNCKELPLLDISTFNTSNVTNMYNMFSSSIKLATIDMTGLDVSKVTTLQMAFYNCPLLTNIIGFGDLEFSSIERLNSAFQMSKISNISINCGEKHPVSEATSAFENCTELLSATITGMECASFSSLFSGCNKLTQVSFINCSLPQSGGGGYLSYMFSNCSNLTSIDLSWIDNSNRNLSQSRNMFSNCTSLTHIDLRCLVFSKCGNTSAMFGTSSNDGVPDNCEIIVKDDTQKTWVNTNFSRLTNVKTVAEYEA